MTSKSTITRFLNSLGLSDLERIYDLSIVEFARDKDNSAKWIIILNKTNPWDYDVFAAFLNGLAQITYPYDLTFTYTYEPTPLDIINLFDPWYQANYHLPSNQKINIVSGNMIEFVFASEATYINNEQMLKDFQSLL